MATAPLPKTFAEKFAKELVELRQKLNDAKASGDAQEIARFERAITRHAAAVERFRGLGQLNRK